MQRVYSATHALEAHFVQGLLQSAGINAVVQGVFLSSGFGELPITDDTMPSVWIIDPKDLPQAQQILREYQSPQSFNGSFWWCTNCGERIEPQFTDCWKCAYAHP